MRVDVRSRVIVLEQLLAFRVIRCSWYWIAPFGFWRGSLPRVVAGPIRRDTDISYACRYFWVVSSTSPHENYPMMGGKVVGYVAFATENFLGHSITPAGSSLSIHDCGYARSLIEQIYNAGHVLVHWLSGPVDGALYAPRTRLIRFSGFVHPGTVRWSIEFRFHGWRCQRQSISTWSNPRLRKPIHLR